MRSGGVSGERRVVTALFCDVVGSTSLAESMDPEDWGALVGGAVEIMGSGVSRYGGTVSEFAGDAVVAFFGAPQAHEDDPYRAVRSGLEICREISESIPLKGASLNVRVGVHTGLVVVREVEAGDLTTYSALGDTVNVAARLQGIAEPGSVIISAETRRLLGLDVDAISLGPVPLGGRKAPVEVFRVMAVAEPAERRRGLPGLTSPLVGREKELGLLKRAFDEASAGSGRVVAVLGDPGVGKSRLVAELEGIVGADVDMAWAVGRCVPFDEDVPYHLAAGLIRSLAGLGASENSEIVVKGVGDLVDGAGVEEHGSTLRKLVGVEEVDARITAEELASTYSEAVIDLVEALSQQRRPVVLVCEDSHWADPSSVDLVEALVEVAPTMPVLLIMAMRGDRDSGGWRLLEHARRSLAQSLVEIELERLGDADSRMLISHLLEIDALPDRLRRQVMEKADGNPFFLEEVVRMLIERELVSNRDGRWLARANVDELEVPETIQGLLASRIDLLPDEVKRAGRTAAVLGRRFQASLFAEVFPASNSGDHGASLDPNLASLEAQGMIQLEALHPELEFGFRHALIHDVMYEGLLLSDRRQLHRKVAEVVERLPADALDGQARMLANHYAAAGENDKAVHYLFIAADRALAVGARQESANSYRKAYEIVAADSAGDPRLIVDAALGLVTAGSGFIPGDEAIEILESVLPVAQSIGDADLLARVYERIIWTRGLLGESYASPTYREQLDGAYELTRELSDAGTAALLSAMMGGAHRSGDEYEASVEPLRGAVDGLAAAGRLAEASYNAAMLADSLTQLGRFAEAVEAIDRATELGELSGDPNSVLDADIIRGTIAADRGDLAEAMEYTMRGIAGAEEEGNTFCNLAGNFKLADQQLRLGDVDAAIAHLEKSTGLAQFCNAGGYEALGHAWLAATRARAGDLRPDDFEGPLDSAIESGSRSTEGLVRLQRAIAFASAGRYDEARSDFESAIELFESYGGLPNLARARHAYGQALEASGDPDSAATQLEAAEDLFEKLGIRSDDKGVDREN